MGNLVRGPKHILVNQLTQLEFGSYVKDGEAVLFYKPTGLVIPGTNQGLEEFSHGWGQESNLEYMLLNLVAPYPSDISNYDVTLNIGAIPRKQGGVKNHRELYNAYSVTLPSLDVAVNGEVAPADKLEAMRKIINLNNHDKQRLANMGMFYVLKETDANAVSNVVITLQDGTSVEIETAATEGLAGEINDEDLINGHVSALGPDDSTALGGEEHYVILRSNSPGFFSVEAGNNNVEVESFYLGLEQLEPDVVLVVDGGTNFTKWEKMLFSQWAATANDGNSGAIDIDINGQTINIPTNGAADAAPTALAIASAINEVGAHTEIPDNVVLAAGNLDTQLIIWSIGMLITNVDEGAANGDWDDIEQSNFNPEFSILSPEHMSQIFPNGYGNEFQNVQLPDPNSRYFKLKFKWFKRNFANHTMDGVLMKSSEVSFYIKEDQIPATVAAATQRYWEGQGPANDNYMNDEVPAGADTNPIELFNLLAGVTLTDDDLVRP